jgi:putative nucleotidyltransferase with HDIG domain
LLRQHEVPEHIISHSVQVERVADYLARCLNDIGAGLDLRLVKAGALLHDIAKVDGLRTGRNHAQTGGALVGRLGYPRVAEVVEHHVFLPESAGRGEVHEDGVVNYADKRVLHDRIVSLEERFEDLLKRYGSGESSAALIAAALERAKQMEQRIFRDLPIGPEDLVTRLGEYPP